MIDRLRRLDWLLMPRFAMVGLFNAGFSYLLFACLIFLGLPTLAALVLAAAGSIAFNFQTARRLVFRVPGRSVRFIAMYIILLVGNWLLLRLLKAGGLSDIVAQGLLVLPIAALSFVGQTLFVFGGRTTAPPPTAPR